MYSTYTINIITSGIPSRILATIVLTLGTILHPSHHSLITAKHPLFFLNHLSSSPPPSNHPLFHQCHPLTSSWLKLSKLSQCCRLAWQPSRIRLGFWSKVLPSSNRQCSNPLLRFLPPFPHWTFLFPHRHHLPLAAQAHRCKGNTFFLPLSEQRNRRSRLLCILLANMMKPNRSSTRVLCTWMVRNQSFPMKMPRFTGSCCIWPLALQRHGE